MHELPLALQRKPYSRYKEISGVLDMIFQFYPQVIIISPTYNHRWKVVRVHLLMEMLRVEVPPHEVLEEE